LALRLGFPGNYKSAAGRNFAIPAIDYIIQQTGMHVEYSEHGYELLARQKHEFPVIQVAKDESF